ncbi:MAG: formylglycine-generating enzyme family protein [Deltaproteobacteria bacterium]|nr:formylglycine-generating enzyme family protein [Deltaproteobacteria bacterium]MBI3293437.1 formylglycine-generating enzyme family protein [Deltaproteobacteria bacterium]
MKNLTIIPLFLLCGLSALGDIVVEHKATNRFLVAYSEGVLVKVKSCLVLPREAAPRTCRGGVVRALDREKVLKELKVAGAPIPDLKREISTAVEELSLEIDDIKEALDSGRIIDQKSSEAELDLLKRVQQKLIAIRQVEVAFQNEEALVIWESDTNLVYQQLRKIVVGNETVHLQGVDQFKFVTVNAGKFLMGSPANELGRESDETPHEVTISKAFKIQTTEVSQSDWEKVTKGGNPSRFQGANRPVECITWWSAVAFTNEVSRLQGLRPAYDFSGVTFKGSLKDGTLVGDGKIKIDINANGYRLPTEAEWEYAARGGNDPKANMKTAYSFGDDPKQLGSFAWFSDNSGRQTHDVAESTKSANPLGLRGMHGNVWEWVEDAFQENLGIEAVTDPRNDSGSGRVIRGGSWGNVARFLRSAFRFRNSAEDRNVFLGLRLVRPE